MKAKKWVKDSKIARKLYSGAILETKDDMIQVEYDSPMEGISYTIPSSGIYNIIASISGLSYSSCHRRVSAGDEVFISHDKELHSIKTYINGNLTGVALSGDPADSLTVIKVGN